LNIDDEPHAVTLRLAESFPASATKPSGHVLSQAWSTGDIKADGKVRRFSPFSSGQRGTLIVTP